MLFIRGVTPWLVAALWAANAAALTQPRPPLCEDFKLAQVHRLGPGRPLFGHVQGLEVSEEFFFITAVTENRESGYLYLYPRHGRAGREPVHQYDLAELARLRATACAPLDNVDNVDSVDNALLNHPSGIHLRGTLLHVAIAPSANRGPACVFTLDLEDPSNPVVTGAVRIDDHIGAVVQLPDGNRIGFNWGSEDTWRLGSDGSARLVPVREELNGRLAEKLHIQDCDLEDDTLYCTHNDNQQDNLLKVYAAAAFDSGGETLQPLAITPPRLGSLHGGTHEGIAVLDGRLFLLPDDGTETGVAIYELGCKSQIHQIQ